MWRCRVRPVLAPLELGGVCTAKVESLASFFLRLAAAHQVTPAQLAKVVCNGSDYLRTGLGVTLKGGDVHPVTLCSHSTQSRVLVQRLEKLTGAHYLACGTLLPLSAVLCGNQCGALVHRRRWCPKCYAASSPDCAEPLAWWLPFVKRCDDHRVRLEDRCGYCGAFQRPWLIGEARRFCCKCARPLWQEHQSPRAWTPWEIWCHVQIMNLLVHVATPGSPVIDPKALSVFVTALPHHAITSRSRLGLALISLKHGWKQRAEPRVRLETVFRLAALWGTTPLDILLRPTEAATPSLFNSKAAIPPPATRPRHPQSSLAKCEQRFRALLALPSMVLLPSPKRVCTDCKVDYGTFRIHHPDLWTRYLDERNHQRGKQKCQSVYVAACYVDNLLRQACQSGERLRLKNATARMMVDIHVSKAIARSALRCALTRMRVERDAARQAP